MKIICIGLNYRKHAIELGWSVPSEPVVFLKPDSSILKNNKPFFLPDFSSDIQFEVEVVIKISKLGKGISAKFAPRYFDERFIPITGIKDLADLDFRLEINDKVVQKSNTSDMIFGFNEIIEYVSKFFTLKTGDLIFTGTPPGVGKLHRNDNLVAYLSEESVLDFLIK
jgi:2-keto-4-pentenoate hydratase/2-oxohepta-3-ene-1,7-dioic acid hydratase in catechol pathway